MSSHLKSPPSPEDSEIVVWEHRGAKARPLNTARYAKLGKLIYWCMMFCLAVFWLWQGLRFDWSSLSGQEIQSQLLSEFGPFLIFLLIGLVIGKYLKSKSEKNVHKYAASGIPVWLSTTRLAFEPSSHIKTNVLNIRDIKSIELNYSEGSRALVIAVLSRSFTLISSDAEGLLSNLYILRPDLERT